MKEFNKLKGFKNLKFQSVIPQDILQAVGLLETLGYEAGWDFNAGDAAKHNGICAWDDGEITEGWLDTYSGFKQVTLDELREMVGSDKAVLWLNIKNLEEKVITDGKRYYSDIWVEVPEGATFATGDKDNFVFRKDGWYYDNQKGWWVKGGVNLHELYKHEFVKLFWVKSDVKDNVFTLDRLLGCEFKLFDKHFYLNEENLKETSRICKQFNKDLEVGLGCLTFFTEDGDELTFGEYVNMYYGEKYELN